MSLSEKAKIEFRCSRCNREFFNTQSRHFAGGHICEGQIIEYKWVRLEDARQEIDGLNSHYKKLAKDRDNLWKIVQSLTNEVNDYASENQKNLAERGEQKKKLQQMLKLWDNQGHLGIVLQETDWLLGEFGQLRKLELLKK